MNIYTTAASLDTDEKAARFLETCLLREEVESGSEALEEFCEVMNLVKLKYPEKLLLSEEWQLGFEAGKKVNKTNIFSSLESCFSYAETRLQAASVAELGQLLAEEFLQKSYITNADGVRLFETIKKQTQDFNSDSLSMFDSEADPETGDLIAGGGHRLFYWSEENLEKYIPLNSKKV